MPSSLHEVVVQLFRDRPTLAVDFVAARLGEGWRGARSVEVLSGDVAQLAALQHRADAVLRVEPAGGGTALCLILEVQLAVDPNKLFTWPLYLCGLRAKLRCPALLLVVTPDRAVAKWAARRISLGPGSDGIQPLVFGPDAIPAVSEVEAARAAPELALLSVIAHAKDSQGIAAAVSTETALIDMSAEGLIDKERFKLYTDLILDALGPKARKALETLMETGYEYKSEILREWVAEGRAKGLAEGKAASLLAVLAARQLPVSETQRAAILACRDQEQLDRWISRAVTAASSEDLLG